MKINKQLFEDVLSGKLKGTFVLKNGFIVRSNRLFDSSSTNSYVYALRGFSTSFTALGKSSSTGYDIIDFIPDTNMKENELTIEIPDNRVVDWDESKKQNRIVLKDKQLTYEDICKKLFKDNNIYYTNSHGRITSGVANYEANEPNNASTKHQLECILAKNKLANVAKFLNDGWKPNSGDHVYYLTCELDELYTNKYSFYACANLIVFKTQKDAEQAIKILGEDTVKLALEPLGI